ncbi:MAG: ribosome maturation factor RimP [Clostridia bacterium]|nr:ribosome maturation factor RimP [Clostridia bacterium]
MPKKAGSAIAEITAIAEKLADQMGYELIEAAYEKENTGMYLRFYLDKEGGITLDDCEAYHRALQPKLERFDYDFMEVCSPGVDRPIKNQRDADRCLGMDIEVRLYKPIDGQKVYNGLFIGYRDGDITIKIGENERTFLKKEIAVARCTIDMEEVENADLS